MERNISRFSAAQRERQRTSSTNVVEREGSDCGSPGQGTENPPIVPAIWAKESKISHIVKYSHKTLAPVKLHTTLAEGLRAGNRRRPLNLLTTNQVAHTIKRPFMMNDPMLEALGPAVFQEAAHTRFAQQWSGHKKRTPIIFATFA